MEAVQSFLQSSVQAEPLLQKILWSFQKQILDLFKNAGSANVITLEKYFCPFWDKNDYFLSDERLKNAFKQFRESLQINEVAKIDFAEMIKKYRLLTRKFLLTLGQSGVSLKTKLLSGPDIRIQIELGNAQYQLGWPNAAEIKSAKKVRPVLLRRQQQLAGQMQKTLKISQKLHELVQTKVSPGLNQELLLAFVEKLANQLKEISLQFAGHLNQTLQGNLKNNQDADPIEMTLLALVAMDLKNLKPQVMQISNLLKKYLKEGTLGFADFVSSSADRETVERLAKALQNRNNESSSTARIS